MSSIPRLQRLCCRPPQDEPHAAVCRPRGCVGGSRYRGVQCVSPWYTHTITPAASPVSLLCLRGFSQDSLCSSLPVSEMQAGGPPLWEQKLSASQPVVSLPAVHGCSWGISLSSLRFLHFLENLSRRYLPKDTYLSRVCPPCGIPNLSLFCMSFILPVPPTPKSVGTTPC